jgi:hypothetical protein
MQRTKQLGLELRIGASIDCRYDLDDPYIAAIIDRAPDRCEPASGGAVVELDFNVADVCVEDDTRDLLTGASKQAQLVFVVALQTLLEDYERRTRAYTEQLEEHERTADHGR